jgi:hypothetical protein
MKTEERVYLSPQKSQSDQCQLTGTYLSFQQFHSGGGKHQLMKS